MPKKKLNSREFESEIFATVNTINKLYSEYKQGNIKDFFFQKSIKNAMNNLINLNIKLNEENIDFSELLDKMKFTKEYYNAISIINEVSSLEFATDNYPKSVSSSILKIPKITSDITSAFITLMDAIKLYDPDTNELIQGLFNDLIHHLEKFPGLEGIKRAISKIFTNFINSESRIALNKNFRNSFVDEIYKVYKTFQHKLTLADN